MNVLSLSDGESAVLIDETVASLQVVTGTAEAVRRIGTALSRYTVFDLQYIGGFIRREVEKLPDPYRRAYRPYCSDLLDQYHVFMRVYRTNGVSDAPLTDPVLWHEFWEVARVQCFVRSGRSDDPFPQMEHPLSKFFYRLVYGYVMLIAGGYGHPIGMPFPGGATVRREGERVLCPIRDKERDLPSALCNFCPAEQDPRYR
ncbi:DUF2115 domain-containing protein [Methanocorpusculum sp. MG]|uniref:UPF0305 protein O0S10_08225 n=1 Tax=Methanocorpusculum petauri TaxID=3002863 RepID=A0ABT4IHJ5_9EURY|nr:DUF2115 domain-containing protein [Methanocorpusculum petauri]MCZ0861205.1 DUF2115 domain-containing protein [Methanocorpusculum petauri]